MSSFCEGVWRNPSVKGGEEACWTLCRRRGVREGRYFTHRSREGQARTANVGLVGDSRRSGAIVWPIAHLRVLCYGVDCRVF